MLKIKDYEFWFVVGSQILYGADVLAQVKKNAQDLVENLNKKSGPSLPYKIVLKPIMTNAEQITQIMQEANSNNNVAGIITWMHTFSPAKNWIRGMQILQKPLAHFATQYLEALPYETIDFDYMNLHQSAHGDREYGFINARLRKNNKVIFGHWSDTLVQKEISNWMDVAVGYVESFNIKVARFGDNMRSVAVTEGDKVEAQIKFGWTVDYYAVGDLVNEISKVKADEIEKEFEELKLNYDLNVGKNDPAKYNLSVKEQLKQYIGIKSFLKNGTGEAQNYTAYTTNFQDLYGLKQLPGLASQLLMRDGYGFGAEGDWKTAALGRLIKIIVRNIKTSFMEDYTYDLSDNYGFIKHPKAILGAHMLEIDPSIASNRPRVEVHPLAIGAKEDPARLVFDGVKAQAINVTISDFGDEFKMIASWVDAKKPPKDSPNLPVAKQIWTPKVGVRLGCQRWIEQGGGHHFIFSVPLTIIQVRDLAKMFGVKLAEV